MRLQGKIAIVVRAGQTPGDTIGNGRATAILFAREGAKVMLVDRDMDSAEETGRMIADENGESFSFAADISREEDCRKMAEACVNRYGRIDILQNNVGIGENDAGPLALTEEALDHIFAVNFKGAFFSCKHVVPVMREQKSGVVTNISSVAAVCSVGITAYKTSKAALNAYSHALAMANAKFGVRVNAIMPGLMDTPMAIEFISKAMGVPKEELRKGRDALVPLRGKQGTAWDVAYASLFLASDEARFITGVVLPVDGGQSAKIG
jgi:NAD(P)-dependent dehydrogenase (short-subunit alcohol dehydrogenase family)